MLAVLVCVEQIDEEEILELSEECLFVHDTGYAFFGNDAALVQRYRAFDISLRANDLPVPFTSTRHTLPNPPFPTTYFLSSSERIFILARGEHYRVENIVSEGLEGS